MFQTLRRSCETHLIALGHPQHVVSAWLGHSERVSKNHYLMVTSADFAKATRLPAVAAVAKEEPVQKGAKCGAVQSRKGSHGAEKADLGGEAVQVASKRKLACCNGLRQHASGCEGSGGGTRTPDTRIMIPLL